MKNGQFCDWHCFWGGSGMCDNEHIVNIYRPNFIQQSESLLKLAKLKNFNSLPVWQFKHIPNTVLLILYANSNIE